MSKTKSKAVLELEARVAELSAYQVAFWCQRKGEQPVVLSSGEDDRRITVELLGAARAEGGVVIVGSSVLWATTWLATARNHVDSYVRAVAHKVERAQTRAVQTRVEAHGSRRPPEPAEHSAVRAAATTLVATMANAPDGTDAVTVMCWQETAEKLDVSWAELVGYAREVRAALQERWPAFQKGNPRDNQDERYAAAREHCERLFSSGVL